MGEAAGKNLVLGEAHVFVLPLCYPLVALDGGMHVSWDSSTELKLMHAFQSTEKTENKCVQETRILV
jgi:hypothetical protein